jgi:hypothetical protein
MNQRWPLLTWRAPGPSAPLNAIWALFDREIAGIEHRLLQAVTAATTERSPPGLDQNFDSRY